MVNAEPVACPDRRGTRGWATRAPVLVGVFHALSDPTRLRILEALRQSEQCVCNLTEILDTRQSLLSFHLKTLREAGLVADRRDGRWIHYSMVPGALEEVRKALGELMEVARPPGGACCGR